VKYLLDTNVCIAYLRVPHSLVRAKLTTVRASEVVLCSLVKEELYYGTLRSATPAQSRTDLERFLAQFASLPFDDRAADVAARIRADLAAQGTPIGTYDLLIAAIALTNSLSLVTHNTREFGRVAGLSLEDWEAGP
jgi:tRNA(fMet)-specific endonuclease VapC